MVGKGKKNNEKGEQNNTEEKPTGAPWFVTSCSYFIIWHCPQNGPISALTMPEGWSGSQFVLVLMQD